MTTAESIAGTGTVGITSVLQSAQSPDATLRGQAEQHLQQLRENNHAQFVMSLAEELCEESKPIDTRRLAGLILKNELDARDEARKNALVQKWVELPAELKSNIKGRLVVSLGSQVTEVGKVCAQVVAKIGSIEIPRQLWQDLIQILLQNMGLAQHSNLNSLRLCTLETLGYICEELAELEVTGLEQDQVNNILTAIVQGMRKEEPSPEVRYAATCALLNAVDFASVNFENDAEQQYIMQMIFEGTQSPDVKTRRASFECIVAIAAAYYHKLLPYMNDLFAVSCKAIQKDDESVALQAIEVWCTICEEEMDLLDDDDEAKSCSYFIKNSAAHLIPVLLETLTKQEEELQDDGTWDIALAGGTCLGLVANTIEDDVVPLVWPYVQENIGKAEWRFRESATMAFGSILEGPSGQVLAPLVNMAFGFLLNAMNDENMCVRDTTAWTIGRICAELHGSHMQFSVINNTNLPNLVGVMIQSIEGEPVIAEKVCYVLHNLATGYDDFEGDSSPLSQFFQPVVTALLEAANKSFVSQSTKLRYHAYEALNEVIRCSKKDTAGLVLQMIPLMTGKLQETLSMPVQSAEDREKQNELQGLLCSVLQVVIQKLSSIDNNATKVSLMAYSDQLMTLFLQVFACRSATVLEEALLAVGALVNAMGTDFLKYMDAFFPYIETGLQNFAEYQVCTETVELVGDLCRALGPYIAKYCDKIMFFLLNDLQAQNLHRSVKPSILSCFGDIALAIEGQFQKYAPYALTMLESASALSIQTQQVAAEDDDMIDYNNSLRNGILEAYSGLFQGFKNSKQQLQAFHDNARQIIAFIESIYMDPNRADSVTKNAVWVLGDVADTLENVGPFFAEKPFYRKFLTECKNDTSLSDTAQWALERITLRISKNW